MNIGNGFIDQWYNKIQGRTYQECRDEDTEGCKSINGSPEFSDLIDICMKGPCKQKKTQHEIQYEPGKVKLVQNVTKKCR